MEDYYKPNYRNQLKAMIFRTGYRKLADFAKDSHVDPAVLSRIIAGSQTPGPSLQKRIAQNLCITLKELKQVL